MQKVYSKEHEKCIICSNNKFKIICKLYKTNKIIVECNHCKNAFTSPPPSVVQDYDFSKNITGENITGWRSFAIPIIDIIKRYKPQGNILDVGCGAGILIGECNKLGYRASGVEINHGAVEYCKKNGLDVREGDFKSEYFPKNEFDVIILQHVLEHIEEPIVFMEDIYKVLKHGGIIIICQTNYQGFIPRIFKSMWDGWCEQYHFTHFSVEGLTYLMNKTHYRRLEYSIVPLGYKLRFNTDSRFGGLKNILFAVISQLTKASKTLSDQIYCVVTK